MTDPIFSTKVEEQSETYARFIFEPLHPSFAQSVGNALRRTLLSSLPGASIAYVKVEGAPHLFTTLKGVKESVLDIILNLKQLHFAATGEGPYHVSLSVTKPGKVFAKDFTGEVGVVNGDVYIAEVTDPKGKLEIDAIVETGIGYVAAEEKEHTEVGYITLDTAFSPVKKVNFLVEDARVGRKSDFERLVLEVWTDGSVTPVDALKASSDMMSKHFAYVLAAKDVEEHKNTGEIAPAQKEEADSKLYDVIIDELNLPSRVINALLRENIETVADLVEKGREKLVVLKGVGRKSIDLIDEELKKMGIELK
ncbi:DNA-directed RNA polymerase subunit alpha [Candidatus Roizmanbacteria bacterium]|nr:DNA-directed RNA polymerase subunit alpha [Candidatus Roizmanbacteria bacterium]